MKYIQYIYYTFHYLIQLYKNSCVSHWTSENHVRFWRQAKTFCLYMYVNFFTLSLSQINMFQNFHYQVSVEAHIFLQSRSLDKWKQLPIHSHTQQPLGISALLQIRENWFLCLQKLNIQVSQEMVKFIQVASVNALKMKSPEIRSIEC